MTKQPQERITGLLEEEPISFYPSAAEAFGVNEAIVLQQISFYMNINKKKHSQRHFKNGRWWVFNTYKQWCDDHFPWLSERGLQGVILGLEKLGVLLSMQGVENPRDRRKWYSVDRKKVAELVQSATQKRAMHDAKSALSHDAENVSSKTQEVCDENTESTSETTYREEKKKDYASADANAHNPRFQNPDGSLKWPDSDEVSTARLEGQYSPHSADSQDISLEGKKKPTRTTKPEQIHTSANATETPFPKVAPKGFPPSDADAENIEYEARQWERMNRPDVARCIRELGVDAGMDEATRRELIEMGWTPEQELARQKPKSKKPRTVAQQANDEAKRIAMNALADAMGITLVKADEKRYAQIASQLVGSGITYAEFDQYVKRIRIKAREQNWDVSVDSLVAKGRPSEYVTAREKWRQDQATRGQGASQGGGHVLSTMPLQNNAPSRVYNPRLDPAYTTQTQQENKS